MFIRGDLNAFRKGLINKAYDKLDKNKDGQVTIQDLELIYDVSHNPDIV